MCSVESFSPLNTFWLSSFNLQSKLSIDPRSAKGNSKFTPTNKAGASTMRRYSIKHAFEFLDKVQAALTDHMLP